MANVRTRVGGSGFTTFNWTDAAGTHIIGMAENVVVNPVQPVAQPVAIQPINAQRPVEIITPGAHTNGTITLTLTEVYSQSVWQRFAALSNSQDIVDIMRTLNALDKAPQVMKVIEPGHNPPGSRQQVYTETFYGIAVASVEDQGETITFNTMNIPKNMTLWYTHSTKDWINAGDYIWPRNVDLGITVR